MLGGVKHALPLVPDIAGQLAKDTSPRLRRGILEHIVRDAGSVKVTKLLAHAFGLRRKAFRHEIDRMIADGAALRWLGETNVLTRRKHHMLSLSLTDDELATLVFSLRATIVQGSSNSDIRDATLLLADVLRQASPMTRGCSLPAGMGRASPPLLPRTQPGDAVAVSDAKTAIRGTMAGWTKLVIHYTDASSARTERTVWPVTTVCHGSTLVAWCELREAFRHFRIDHIAMPKVTQTPIPRLLEDLLHAWRSETGGSPDTNEEED